MFYNLNQNVYLVKGVCRSCIYDFNASKLYSINAELASLLEEINAGKVIDDNLSGYSEDAISVLQELKQNGIVMLAKESSHRTIDELKGDLARVEMAWVEITTRCNMRCVHCYNESDYHCDTFMSQDDFQHVIDNLQKMNVRRLQLIGGEPFADSEALRGMLDYACGKFNFLEVFTNGTLITKEWYRYLSKNNIRVALSVYSYNPQIHDSVTKGKGSWIKTNNTIKMLKESNVKYRVCNILMKGVDIGEKNTDLYELSRERDVVRMTGRAGLALLTDDLIHKRLITKSSFSKPLNTRFVSKLISGHNCFTSKIYVAANLDVFPCVMERRIKHCNVKGAGGITIKDSIRSLNKDCIRSCCGCEYRYACFDCRPNSLVEDVAEKPWYCTYDPASGTWEEPDSFIKKLRERQYNECT